MWQSRMSVVAWKNAAAVSTDQWDRVCANTRSTFSRTMRLKVALCTLASLSFVAACNGRPDQQRILCREAEHGDLTWLFDLMPSRGEVTWTPDAPDAQPRTGRLTQSETRYDLRFEPIAERFYGAHVNIDRIDGDGVVTIGAETDGPIVWRINCEAGMAQRF